jgi:phosphatidylglycerophosphatase A
MAIATALGVGYIPKAPGTFGSLVGVLIYVLSYAFEYLHFPTDFVRSAHHYVARAERTILEAAGISIFIAVIGVWVSSSVARFTKKRDPPFVVVDEVSGQHLALVIGSALPTRWGIARGDWLGYPFASGGSHSVLGWKYLVLGFILFRLLDIWKPFPARQAERLSGGWGIMADDWVAASYAALGLWIARYLGL